MRPLKSHFPVHALTTLATRLKQTKEARVFRRSQAGLDHGIGHWAFMSPQKSARLTLHRG